MARCPKCAGSGADPDAPAEAPAPCPTCGGSGELGEEQPELL